jgi:hypothetical protein
MTEMTDAASAPTLAGRPPAASVIAQCLVEQLKLGPRRRIADVLGLSPLADDAVPWFKGALGELTVARELAGLDASAGWTVLHAVPVGSRDSDIDHVVIGPAGVFTINSKHHAGQRVSTGRSQVFVSGQAHNYIRNSAFEAERASKLLTEATGLAVTARPVLTFVGAKEIAGKREVGGVHILGATGLVRWLSKQPAIWGTDAAATVARAATLPSTWRAAELDVASDEANGAVFAELQRKAAAMERIRSLWALVGVLAVLGGAYAALQVLLHAL